MQKACKLHFPFCCREVFVASQWLVAAREGSRGHWKTLHDVLDLGWLKQQMVEFIKIQILDNRKKNICGKTVLVATITMAQNSNTQIH